ncbi:hypothetical protein I7I53_10016 [Histoplasma capsulatum var. duboisii H88]|uniref:Uncharacterized protein n=1 Tax=Ajellomyces capsulatus (strain H88) TaxID=544711 RepID=A0A8A1LB02_AJEC8|nr:hypothetical protein I7I53_10016 [Histoplasma capsulatum var. duboisii H88]
MIHAEPTPTKASTKASKPARTFPSSSNQPIASPIASPERAMCWRIVCREGEGWEGPICTTSAP